MSGENWDPAWRQGRDLYRDVWLVSQQAWLAAEIAGRFGQHPAVVGWLVSNEMPLYGGAGTSDEITAWARLVVQAVRSTGATQPISLGDGAWGVEVSGNDNGYSLRELAPLVDFVGPHVYPDAGRRGTAGTDRQRSSASCRAASASPSCSRSSASPPTSPPMTQRPTTTGRCCTRRLIAGARGWIAWNNCDYDDLRDEDPYRHHGVRDALRPDRPDRASQAAAAASWRSSRRSSAGSVDGWEPVKGGAAIVVPEHFERVLPFTTPAYRQDIRDNLFQSYIAALEADIPVELVRERDGLETAARLILAPCAKLLSAPGIDRSARARRRRRDGLPLLLRGQHAEPARAVDPMARRRSSVCGIGLRYGLVDPILENAITFEFVRSLGEIEAGARLSFRVAGEASARAFLPVEPAAAEIVAVDGMRAAPRCCAMQSASGQTVLCTYPLEHLAARTPRANPEDTWRLYSALASEAEVSRPVQGRRPADPRRSHPAWNRRARPFRQLLARRRRSCTALGPTFPDGVSPRSIHARPVRCRDRFTRERVTRRGRADRRRRGIARRCGRE